MSSSGKILGSHGGAYSGTGLLSLYVILSNQWTPVSKNNPIPPPSGSSNIPPKQQCQLIRLHGNSTQKTNNLVAAENVTTLGKWPTER